MLDKILHYTIIAGIWTSFIMIVFLLYYMVTRKSIYDKIIASDLIAMPLICAVVFISMYYKTLSYTSLILIIALVCFIGTVVTTRYLNRGEVFTDDDSK
ncbi:MULTISPECIES: monovalent cation/H+ antiporter complex subunit F [unclassified Gemella]|uniref:monovalent cation/H+ antiporter complex subunit F n=1 Tax=unclassified Gemella TaxID=2624949 RepID=UPI001074507B|nr:MULTISPECIES: monovalent cation/H+ antiporter complex subunit F [unclassified Gemella]MBF0710709.1 pH regulation protein F [Gemella sp. GL1.1]MBF0746722.1 pH regulation protein F [Gemella sp. 19428wG2_WT2a]NYS28053.1 pH regulation protein F [Gemella sp. GL1]TFU60070.1 pH regulation protein F [Gemella sp. WT2a]